MNIYADPFLFSMQVIYKLHWATISLAIPGEVRKEPSFIKVEANITGEVFVKNIWNIVIESFV